MMRRIVIWIAGLAVVTAMVATDMLPTLAAAQEPVTLLPRLTISAPEAEPAVIHVAQQKKKRRTLMDMLFGNDDEPAQPSRRQQQLQPLTSEEPAAPAKKAALPPPKPEVLKAPNATRLAVMGDSMAVDVAKALERFYVEDPNIVIVPMGVGSSGFVRPDFFDWNQTVTDEIAKNSFDLAVVIIGINDRQTLNTDGESYKPLTETWTQIYKARVESFVGKFRTAGKPVIWVGLPPMSKAEYSQSINAISAIHRLAAFGGGAEFLDIYERFVDEEGKYSSFGPDLNGQRVRMRKDDGIHFSAGGADKLAFYLSQSIKLFYRGGGGVSFEVADPLAGSDAQLMVRPPYQGLGQIRLLEVAGAVVPLTNAPRRAVELLTADSAGASGAFDLSLLVQAPVGRVDAFGVGVVPVSERMNAGGR